MAMPSDPDAPGLPARRALGLALAVGAAVMALDQAIKWLIVAYVMEPPRVIEVTGFFNLVLTYNTGVSFGLLRGAAPWHAWILIAIALAVVVGLLVWLARQPRPQPLLAVAVGVVMGGALGNVIDRMHGPGVIDFLDFHVAGWHWPAFNLADSAITLGVILIVLDGLFSAPRGCKT